MGGVFLFRVELEFAGGEGTKKPDTSLPAWAQSDCLAPRRNATTLDSQFKEHDGSVWPQSRASERDVVVKRRKRYLLLGPKHGDAGSRLLSLEAHVKCVCHLSIACLELSRPVRVSVHVPVSKQPVSGFPPQQRTAEKYTREQHLPAGQACSCSNLPNTPVTYYLSRVGCWDTPPPPRAGERHREHTLFPESGEVNQLTSINSSCSEL